MLPNYQARSPFVLMHTTSLYICLDVCMSFCTLTLRIFVFARCSTPSQTSLNIATITRITLEIELFTVLNCFAGAVKTQKLMGAPFLFELVAVVSLSQL